MGNDKLVRMKFKELVYSHVLVVRVEKNPEVKRRVNRKISLLKPQEMVLT